MKFRKNPFLNSLVLSLGIAAAAGTLLFDSAQAQSIRTWDGGAGTNVLNTGANWSSDAAPTISGDTARWNGTVAGDLVLDYTSGFGASPLGTAIDITSGQTGSLRIGSSTDSSFSFQNLTIANGAFSEVASGPGFTFGDGSGNDSITFRNNGAAAPYINTLINNSDRTAVIASNVTFASGAAAARTLVFAGSGNWQVDAPVQIVAGGGGSLAITKNGAGTLTLSAANNYTGNTTLEGGTLALTASTTSNLAGGLTFGATAGTTTSALDLSTSSATFSGATLVQTNSATANTISIGSGKTLTLNNNVTIGANVGGTTTKLTVSGSGALAVNKSGGTFQVGGSTTVNASNAATLDLSGLTTFSADLGSTGIFRVGDNNAPSGFNNPSGGASTVVLAGASTITANLVGIGDVSAQIALQTLRLGSTSTLIKTNTLVVGAKTAVGTIRGNGLINFQSGTGTLELKAADGIGRANVDIANHQVFTGVATTGEIDLSGHSSNLLISTLNIGHRSGGVSNVNGTFSFGTGTLDVSNAVIGKRTGQSSGTSTAILNIGGGTSTFGSIAMGDSNTAGGTANGTLTLTGGSVTLAGNVTRTGGAGTTSATVNLQGATLDMGGFNIGSGTNSVALNAESGTLKNVAAINGTGGITKTTAGTLILDGTNTYTGTTTVSAGSLLLNGQLGTVETPTGLVTVSANGAFGGIGTLIGNVNFHADSKLTIVNLADALTVTGNVTFGSGFGIANLLGIDWDALDLNTAYTLLSTDQAFDADDIANFGFVNSVAVGTGRQAYFTSGSLNLVVIPEPGAALLGGLGLLTLLRRKR